MCNTLSESLSIEFANIFYQVVEYDVVSEYKPNHYNYNRKCFFSKH